MSNLVEYVKWINVDESIEHVGVLTSETDDSITLLTKHGEMTILKSDGVFEESTQEEFQSIIVEEKQVKVKSTSETKQPTKVQQATAIFIKMTTEGFSRKDIINEFKSQLDMGDAGAGTYYQNVKKKIS